MQHRLPPLRVRRLPLVLLLAVGLLMGASVSPAKGQDVPITMTYHPGLTASGPLPTDTEVLVYYEENNSSTMLSERGGRPAMRDSLVAGAEAAFATTYDRLSDDGTTRSIRVPTSPRHRAYVLARVSDGTSGPRFYETQLRGNDSTSPPDLDLVVSGNMNMVPVGDVAWAEATFEAALQHRTVALALQLPGNGGLGAGATARVWTLPASRTSAPNPETLQAGDAQEGAVTADGTTEMSVARTAYSGEAVYVIVRAPGDEGEPVFYESEVQAVTGDALPMERVDQTDRAAIAALFPGSGSEGGGISWLFYGLIGGLVLVIAVVVAARALSGRGKAQENGRRKEGMRERFWKGTSSLLTRHNATDGASDSVEKKDSADHKQSDADQEIVEGAARVSADAEQGGEYANAESGAKANEDETMDLEAEIDAKAQTIAALNEALYRKEEELQGKADTISTLREKRTAAERSASEHKQQADALRAKNKTLREDVDRLSATVAEKDEALQVAQSDAPAVPDDEATAQYIEELEDENEWLEQTVEALRRRLSDAPVEDQGRESIGALYVAELRAKNQQLEATISDLESELTETADALETARSKTEEADTASPSQRVASERVAELEEALDQLKRRLRKDRQTLKNAQETVEHLRSEKQDLETKAQQLRQAEAENEDLKGQVEALRAKIEDLKANRAAALADESPSEPDEAELHAAPAELRQDIGAVFQAWCQQGRVMVGRYYMFERMLQDTYPNATVTPIYHIPDADVPFQFEDRRSTATFWFVEAKRGAFVLPVPRRDETFEALEPAGAGRGEARPPDLVRAIPARMVDAGTGYRMGESGLFEFDNGPSA